MSLFYQKISSARTSAVCFVLVVLVTAACSSPDMGGVACPDLLPPAIEIQVRDSVTNAPAARGATGSVTGPSSTSPFFANNDSIMIGFASAGTYTVLVQKTGYRDWTRNGVEIRYSQTACPLPLPLSLTARLQK